MHFLVLLYQDPATFPTTAAEGDRLTNAYETFTRAAREAGALVDGMPVVPMPDAARTVTIDEIKTGPPVARAQALVGYYVLDYPTIDAAASAAKAIPAAAHGSVEVVPIRAM